MNDKKEFVRIKNGNCEYLTIGKLYEVITWDERVAFTILDDDGDELYCLVNEDGHLEGGNWEIVSKDNCQTCNQPHGKTYGENNEWCENCVPF